MTGGNWLAQYQTTNNLDPVLFSDYRDAQENLLNQDFGSFFNDAYPLPDLGSPTHDYSSIPSQGLEMNKKASLMQTLDAAKDADLPQPGRAPKLLTCNKIWYVRRAISSPYIQLTRVGIDCSPWRNFATVRSTLITCVVSSAPKPSALRLAQRWKSITLIVFWVYSEPRSFHCAVLVWGPVFKR